MKKSKLNLENAYANEETKWCLVCFACVYVVGTALLLALLVGLGNEEIL